MSAQTSTGSAGSEDEESSSNPLSATNQSHIEPINVGDDDAFSSMSHDFISALDEFRDNWQRELKQHDSTNTLNIETTNPKESSQSPRNGNGNHLTSESEKQALAESFFTKAVELEQRGKVYDAIPFYRKAVQIVPDIEFKFYERNKLRAVPTSVDANSIKQMNNNGRSDENVFEEELIEDLYEKFQLDLAQDYGGKLLLSNRDAGVISTELHISDLPPEILLYILRWVVSSQLDMRSLEQCAGVCKGMYLCARDEDLWRSACFKVWGISTGTLGVPSILSNSDNIDTENVSPAVYTSWRQMFIERERVLFNGCYISKTTYLRMGENSFQDQYYRPVQLVEYYRYVRFMPDGTVLMMTNADEPAQGVNKLKHLQQLRPDVLRGHYHLLGNIVTIILKKNQRHINPQQFMSRQRRGSNAQGHCADESNNTTYCIEFRIMSTPKRKFCQLIWVNYSINQTRNKVEISSNFDLTPSKYPPLWFSPVRSYHLDAESPLA